MDQIITDALDEFSQSALCQWLNRPGAANAVTVLAAGALAAPDFVTTAAGLGLLATQMGCAFNPLDPTEKDTCEDGWKGVWYDVTDCEDTDGYNNMYIWQNRSGNEDWYLWDNLIVKKFQIVWEEIDPQTYRVIAKGKYAESTTDGWDFELTSASSIPCIEIRQDRDIDINCVGRPQTGAPPPVIAESPTLNCTLKAELQNYLLKDDGNIVPVIKYTNLSGTNTKNNNGEISGCNWYGDLIYTGGSGGEPPHIGPLPPNLPDGPGGPDIPDWLQDLLSDFAANLLFDQIQELFDAPQPGITYQMTAPCDKDENGDPLVWEKVIPSAPLGDALGLRITALHEQMNQHLAWKTPICNEKPELVGEWRTISFRSEKTSPYGKSRLRKRFRYRSTSGLGLGEIVDHWKDFTFESGPVIVCHSGSSWGTPQVWASTADEGKRVIRHAAGEAGIDPDQVGRWVVSSSSSARVGVSDTMRVDTKGGYYWITAREGSNGRPIVAQVSNP